MKLWCHLYLLSIVHRKKRISLNIYMSVDLSRPWDAITALINVTRQLEAVFDHVLLLTGTEVNDERYSVLGVVVSEEANAVDVQNTELVLPPYSRASRDNFPGGFWVMVDNKAVLEVVACVPRERGSNVNVKQAQVINAVFDVPIDDCVAACRGISQVDTCQTPVFKTSMCQH